MATKAGKKKGSGAKKAKSPAKPKGRAKPKNTAKPKSPAKPKSSSKPKSAARPKAAAASRAPKKKAAPARKVMKARQEPESLRLRGLSNSYTVNDLAASMRFYVDALGFTVKSKWEKDGVLLGVMLVAGQSEIGISQDDWAKGRDRVKGQGFRLYAETSQDLGKLADRIRAQGFAADGPKKEPWGATTVSTADPDGFLITFHDPMD
jgi:catechol 2,3-dioxygenase-like lactoylglutathione lyase family enzyme